MNDSAVILGWDFKDRACICVHFFISLLPFTAGTLTFPTRRLYAAYKLLTSEYSRVTIFHLKKYSQGIKPEERSKNYIGKLLLKNPTKTQIIQLSLIPTYKQYCTDLRKLREVDLISLSSKISPPSSPTLRRSCSSSIILLLVLCVHYIGYITAA